MEASSFVQLNYLEDKAKISRFLEEFKKLDQPKYLDKLKQVSQGRLAEILVELDDVKAFFNDDSLVSNIVSNSRRYHSLFCEAVDSLVSDNVVPPTDLSSPIDVMIAIRRQRDQERVQTGQVPDADNQPFPAALTRR
ncbi:MAG: hypothetical protein SGCHY_000036 [Lobulomycetales sp.]